MHFNALLPQTAFRANRLLHQQNRAETCGADSATPTPDFRISCHSASGFHCITCHSASCRLAGGRWQVAGITVSKSKTTLAQKRQKCIVVYAKLYNTFHLFIYLLLHLLWWVYEISAGSIFCSTKLPLAKLKCVLHLLAASPRTLECLCGRR